MLNALTEQTEEGHSTQRFHFFPSGLLNPHNLSLSSLPCCRTYNPAASQLSHSTRQTSVTNICNNSLAEKSVLTGCHELVGKVFMVKAGNDYFGL